MIYLACDNCYKELHIDVIMLSYSRYTNKATILMVSDWCSCKRYQSLYLYIEKADSEHLCSFICKVGDVLQKTYYTIYTTANNEYVDLRSMFYDIPEDEEMFEDYIRWYLAFDSIKTETTRY
jgi:hypothetical protein